MLADEIFPSKINLRYSRLAQTAKNKEIREIIHT